MTIINKISLCLFILFSAVMLFLLVSFNLETKPQEYTGDYIKYEYTIVKVDDGEYYGKHEDGTGIYFTRDNLQPDQIIKEGNQIYAFFKKGNFEQLEKVTLIKNE